MASTEQQQPPSPSQTTSAPSLPSAPDPGQNLFLLPIPTQSSNKSQAAFTYSDGVSGVSQGSGLFDPLPPEIASADISIAPDGSFVETSSGPAARELKRRYDQHYGVNKDVRSPYAITAFVNQHGRQMFRIGHRELTAPGAAAAEVEKLISAKSTTSHVPRVTPYPSSGSSHPRSKRPSRLSVHTFLHPPMFRHGAGSSSSSTTVAPAAGASSVAPVSSGHPPAPAHAPSASASGPARKLRRSRSIPENLAAGTTALPQQPLNTATSRGHSHSVTSADMPRLSTTVAPAPMTMTTAELPRLRIGDTFGEVMQLSAPSSPCSVSLSSSSLLLPRENPRSHDSLTPTPTPSPKRRPAIIAYPFGPGVSFDSPSLKSPPQSSLPTPQQHLREMQSFESVMTARQVDPGDRKPALPSPSIPELDIVLDLGTITDDPTFDGSTLTYPGAPEPKARAQTEREREQPTLPPPPPFGPSPETSMHSRYSTDAFDVLQTYRGLPQLDKLTPDAGETTVIKLSLSADETAAPRDDPRFVIWGEVHGPHEADDASVSMGTDVSSSAPSSGASRRRRGRSANPHHHDIPSVRISPGGAATDGAQKVLVAATIERWIAQLTSDLNYDELLNFFLTYRTYISAVDLCHLLICRFHWALSQPRSAQDESARRIVRVRTFVALRYWLLTFFVVDFLGNRELRLLLASWLNTLIRDPVLKMHNDGLSTVRKLKKVVQDCKNAHTRTATDKQQQSQHQQQGSSSSASSPSSNKARPKVSHVLGEKFAEATRLSHDDDSDLDLDFVPEEAVLSSFHGDAVNAHLTAHIGAGTLSPAAAGAGSALTILHQSRVAVIPDVVGVPFVQTAATLPIHHNALSRAFVNTIGRLGRWKRVLNSRSAAAARAPLGVCADVSAFDLELTVSRDLLTVNGGVEQYLKMIEQQQQHAQQAASVAPALIAREKEAFAQASVDAAPVVSEPPLPPLPPPAPDKAPAVPTEIVQAESVPAETAATPVQTPPRPLSRLRGSIATVDSVGTAVVKQDIEMELADDASFRSSSTDSLGVPIASRFMSNSRASQRPPWQFDVVSIDDLTLSDTSSEVHASGPACPPGLRRAGQKRLPLRRDFEFVQRPESVSSMGLTSHRSVVSTTSSVVSAPSSVGLGGNIQQWQVNALVDSLSNDEESGDVEDALRRLEGQINPAKQQEKASKVDGWVRTIRERLAAGDYQDEPPRFMDDDDEEEEEEEEQSPKGFAEQEDVVEETGSQWSGDGLVASSSSISQSGSQSSQDLGPVDTADTSVASAPQAAHTFAPEPVSPVRATHAHLILEDVVPIEILESRLADRPQTFSGLAHPSDFGLLDISRIHRSFILSYRAEVLVEHFSMIDRELFMGVRFEELVSDEWMSCEEVDVLDWAQFLKDRARWKAEHRFPHKTSALAAVRARFNLIANFTVSEVVLTHPSDRAVVVAKLIRMAWRAYSLSSFNTLVAIIAGLQSEWVTKSMHRYWNRVGIWEMRMFTDLKAYTTSADHFKHIRMAIESMVEAKPLERLSHAPSSTGATDGQSGKGRSLDTKGPLPSACIPFIGVYLSQLCQFNRMPDLIDPTAPNEAVSIDPISANFNAPAHPEVFASLTPLPSSMQLEPLINVQKQRLIAGVIKSLVAGQHLASRVQFPIDKKLFQRCLRLRGLDADMLQRAFTMHPD